MKLIRYRKPSLSQMLGVSHAKNRLTRATGGRALRHPSAIVTNWERRQKRKLDYYSPLGKAVRARHLWLGWFKLW